MEIDVFIFLSTDVEICISRAIWDKLPKYIFGNFEIAQVKQGQF